jgi:hypothetical protein
MSSNNEVIFNKQKITTSKDIYNKIYFNEFLELIKYTLSFLLAYLIYNLLTISILEYFKNKKILLIIILFILIFFFTLIALETFTYLKIKSNNESYLDEITKNTK